MTLDSKTPVRESSEVVDSVIVGGGIAGLSAALYLEIPIVLGFQPSRETRRVFAELVEIAMLCLMWTQKSDRPSLPRPRPWG